MSKFDLVIIRGDDTSVREFDTEKEAKDALRRAALGIKIARFHGESHIEGRDTDGVYITLKVLERAEKVETEEQKKYIVHKKIYENKGLSADNCSSSTHESELEAYKRILSLIDEQRGVLIYMDSQGVFKHARYVTHSYCVEITIEEAAGE